MQYKIKTKFLLPILLFVGTFAFLRLDGLPSYTRLGIVFLFLPIIFFVFRKEERINEKKYLIIIAFSVLLTILYDTMAQAVWLWGFPKESVSFWILGIPIEEYLFGFWLPTIVIGVYTMLPSNKKRERQLNSFPHIKESVLFGIIFLTQLAVWRYLIVHPASYIGWMLFLAIAPSLFFVWRKREKIDEYRLLITTIIMLGVAVVIDLFFISANAWYYNELALLGRIGGIPIDDFIFMFFNTLLVIGIYTSLPNKKYFSAKM